MSESIRRVTVPQFAALKSQGRKITMLTAYDYTMAAIVDACDVEGILVGDSMSMVVQGHETTLPVTFDQMLYHAEMVGRAVRCALVVVDLPFPLMHLETTHVIEQAGRVLKETQCQAVKLEGGREQMEVIAALVGAGIPVMAHVGLRPQNVHQMGGYKVARDEQKLLADARAAQDAGAFSIVLECVPPDIAQNISQAIEIPTIGIGAGRGCDGQVLVTHDLVGLTSGYIPKFVKKYADLKSNINDAIVQFRDDVREGKFPGDEQTYK